MSLKANFSLTNRSGSHPQIQGVYRLRVRYSYREWGRIFHTVVNGKRPLVLIVGNRYRTVHLSGTNSLNLVFFYPTAGKLYTLIEHASATDCTPSARCLLDEISGLCAMCQTFGARPLSVHVSLPNEMICINAEISMDLLCLDRRFTLHVVDPASGYSNSAFLDGQPVEANGALLCRYERQFTLDTITPCG